MPVGGRAIVSDAIRRLIHRASRFHVVEPGLFLVVDEANDEAALCKMDYPMLDCLGPFALSGLRAVLEPGRPPEFFLPEGDEP